MYTVHMSKPNRDGRQGKVQQWRASEGGREEPGSRAKPAGSKPVRLVRRAARRCYPGGSPDLGYLIPLWVTKMWSRRSEWGKRRYGGRAVADRTNLPPCEVESRWNENFIRFQKSSYSMSPKITIVCMFSISIFSGAWQENIRFWKQLAKMK